MKLKYKIVQLKTGRWAIEFILPKTGTFGRMIRRDGQDSWFVTFATKVEAEIEIINMKYK